MARQDVGGERGEADQRDLPLRDLQQFRQFAARPALGPPRGLKLATIRGSVPDLLDLPGNEPTVETRPDGVTAGYGLCVPSAPASINSFSRTTPGATRLPLPHARRRDSS